MKVEFAVTDYTPEPHVLELTHQLFATAAADMGIAVEELALVLVADHDHYGQAVERVQPGGSFTNHEGGRGMAKTHTVVKEGVSTTSIVIHLHALRAALAVVACNPDCEENCAIELLCLYLIYHELGHSVDNRRRPDQQSPPISLPGQGFDITQVTRYYANILETEYAACAFAAPWMASDAYHNTVTALAESLTVSRAATAKLKQEYSLGKASLTTLAFTVAGSCWFVLIQFAKIAASRIGTLRLAAEPLPIWPETNDLLTVQLLAELEASLAEHWTIYPHWPREPAPFLREIWEAFALLEGFRFVEDEQGSAVYW